MEYPYGTSYNHEYYREWMIRVNGTVEMRDRMASEEGKRLKQLEIDAFAKLNFHSTDDDLAAALKVREAYLHFVCGEGNYNPGRFE